MRIGPFHFREVWCVDFEFISRPGDYPIPLCLVARELSTGRLLRLWEEDFRDLSMPPYSIGEESLFIAYYASAEFSCHLALGWPLSANVIDLFAEFRNLTNELPLPCGKGLIGALVYFGLDSIGASKKDAMREFILRGGPFNEADKRKILDYCESDVLALEKLLNRMLKRVDIPKALLRGRYMKAVARIEHQGIPVDIDMLSGLRQHWPDIIRELIQEVDQEFGIYEGTTFKEERFESWLHEQGKDWPRLESGKLELKEKVFSSEAKKDPRIARIHELRVTLSQMRLNDLAVGHDGRNRCILSVFSSKTGRNQPSNSKFIFGPAVWLRGLIRPEQGLGLAYIDWAQQEFGIAAALSGDRAMIEAYNSDDPYISFARQAGAIPPNGTKETHAAVREQFKQCILAVQYGMGAQSFARKINQTETQARYLLRLHRETFPRFWQWSDAAVDIAMLDHVLWTVFGWTIHVVEDPNPRSLRNFPVQANGAEILRLACCLATERGIRVCAPVHDAILIEAPLSELEDAVELAETAMAEASEIVLGGFRLRTDAKLIRYPDRYQDERGQHMWQTVCKILEKVNGRTRG